MFILGTAGHIDHGKSAIIKRLTGTDPDRLPEEQARGMTIDIGFAFYDTSDGRRIGIVDVPGHERFVKNMIAGAGGIDAVLLVIAADDGWMPQSQEHLQIIKLLNVKYGLVALSKIDMVDPDWIELITADIQEKLKGSFLEKAPIVPLSSITGEGFDKLKNEIDILSTKVIEKADIGKPRLYVDRSFVLPGMGGVVAGTLRGGKMDVGQSVSVFPSKKGGKIRIIQSHGDKIESASPGQRTSLSLTGIDKEYLGRGNIISTPEIIDDYPKEPVFAISTNLIPEAAISIDNRRRLLMILGTTEVEGEVRLYGEHPIPPGGSGIIFFKPFDPVLSFVGDRLIFRLPTPQVTVGGGMIIDILDRFPRKKELTGFDYLNKRIELKLLSIIESELEKTIFVKPEVDFRWCNYSMTEINQELDRLRADKKIDEWSGKIYSIVRLNPLFDKIAEFIGKELEKQSHVDGLAIDIIAVGVRMSIYMLDPLLELMCDKKRLVKKKNKYDLPDRSISVKGEVKTAADLIDQELIDSKFMPPTLNELIGKDKIRKEAFEYLRLTGHVVKTGGTIAFHKSVWDDIMIAVKAILNRNGELKVGDLKDKLNSTRKYIIPILEETDRQKITVRQEDVRIKGVNFEQE